MPILRRRRHGRGQGGQVTASHTTDRVSNVEGKRLELSRFLRSVGKMCRATSTLPPSISNPDRTLGAIYTKVGRAVVDVVPDDVRSGDLVSVGCFNQTIWKVPVSLNDCQCEKVGYSVATKLSRSISS